MNRLNTLIALFLLLSVVPLAHAARQQPAPANFAASFVETRTLPGFDQPLVSHGIMRFSAEAGFRWEITQPYHYVFQMKQGQASEELPDGTMRQLDPDKTPWLAAVQHIFISALSGDHAQLAQYFQIKSQPVADGNGRHVVLIPLSDAMGKVIARIEVTESSPGHPQHLVIDETSGGKMDMRFTPLPTDDGS